MWYMILSSSCVLILILVYRFAFIRQTNEQTARTILSLVSNDLYTGHPRIISHRYDVLLHYSRIVYKDIYAIFRKSLVGASNLSYPKFKETNYPYPENGQMINDSANYFLQTVYRAREKRTYKRMILALILILGLTTIGIFPPPIISGSVTITIVYGLTTLIVFWLGHEVYLDLMDKALVDRIIQAIANVLDEYRHNNIKRAIYVVGGHGEDHTTIKDLFNIHIKSEDILWNNLTEYLEEHFSDEYQRLVKSKY